MHEASNLICQHDTLVRSVEEQEVIPQLKLNTQMIIGKSYNACIFSQYIGKS